ncbi:DNA helicase RecQ [Alkalicoccobacillus porphyridii]|uniref:DNA helicase RecQ n=1 Tax=Alkalicoccobacillus porphyridii TaxID=2597270 RepID=A0A553ZUE9_9BACI|nr:DNA helicase RecQ [Alkalicoccobacillus porphyridii]TSB45111.1 DNA helicase RecQ [Alkalicoccobacillus porphyridii]
MATQYSQEQAVQLLKQTYGYEQFRPGQQKVIHQVLAGHDTLAIMPTGGGKSICYQLPAMMLEGVTIVISPLISLMKDQVDALGQLGVESTYINSSLSYQEEQHRLQGITEGKFKLIYVAPERLENQSFYRILSSVTVSLVAIDEAHCMSQWGHDFRPSYMNIPSWLDSLPSKPVILALTATATLQVQEDLQLHLSILPTHSVVTGFARPNLQFQVVKGMDKRAYITKYLEHHQSEPGIIYVSTRKEANQLADFLNKKHWNTGVYHGGMTEPERTASQEDFLYDRVQVMIATNAFGMGINKSNVRYVLHYNLPKNLEAYYQEAGRAGRDGEKGECVLLFSGQDIRTQQFFIEQSEADEQFKKNEFSKLQKMISYCHTEGCLQTMILHYFGEEEEQPCGRCSNCLHEGESQDCTKEAQMVFSCVKRMRERYGKLMIAQVLTGSSNQKVKQFNLDQLPTYGLMKNQTLKSVQAFIDYLVAEEYLGRTNSEFPTIKLNELAVNVLLGQQKVMRRVEPEVQRPEEQDEVFTHLRNLRKDLAAQEDIPPYLVFSDKTLKEMSRYIPVTEDQFAQISGVGEQKKKKYAQVFIEVLQNYEDQKPDVEIKSDSAPTPLKSKAITKDNHLQTAKLFSEGATIQQLVDTRQLTERTIINHLIRAESEGEELKLAELVDPKKRELILQTAEQVGSDLLRPIKDHLPEEITYEEIRFVIGK